MRELKQNKLEKALEIALDAHRGQTDKAGEIYILHPIRVMQSVEGRDEKVVALLHDVVEDSGKTFEDLEEEFSEDIVSSVKYLTKREDETYLGFIERAKKNEVARRVKIADIQDNLDARRLGKLDEDDIRRMEKYSRSLKKLKGDEV